MKGCLFPCDQKDCYPCDVKECTISVAKRNPFFQFGSILGSIPYLDKWRDFWAYCEQEWAEAQKKELYYPPSPCDSCTGQDCGYCPENSESQEEPCEYGFSEECVERSLRNTNCCMECWLYNEVDEKDKREAGKMATMEAS